MAHTQSYARKMLSLDLFLLRAHSPFFINQNETTSHMHTLEKKYNVIASNAVFYWNYLSKWQEFTRCYAIIRCEKKHARLYVRLLVCLTTIKIISTFANQLNSDPSITYIESKIKQQRRRIQTITIAVVGFSVSFNWLEIFARMWTWP